MFHGLSLYSKGFSWEPRLAFTRSVWSGSLVFPWVLWHWCFSKLQASHFVKSPSFSFVSYFFTIIFRFCSLTAKTVYDFHLSFSRWCSLCHLINVVSGRLIFCKYFPFTNIKCFVKSYFEIESILLLLKLFLSTWALVFLAQRDIPGPSCNFPALGLELAIYPRSSGCFEWTVVSTIQNWESKYGHSYMVSLLLWPFRTKP